MNSSEDGWSTSTIAWPIVTTCGEGLTSRESYARMSDVANDPYRLPRTTLPDRYDLVLEPDLESRTFDGAVTIALTVHETTREIVCNSVDLELKQAHVEQGGRRIDVTATSFDATAERVTFALAEALVPGTATLKVAFTGVLNDRLVGFYASTYKTEDGSNKTLATSQMEATDARRAFPCWDEPEHKAVFGVTLVVADGLMAVSNSPEIASDPAPLNKRRVTFADTMKMSTYLVCFVVGELVATPAVDVEGIALRVVHRPGQEHLTAFALEVGAFALRHFHEYYDIAYPGKKLDLLAIPDFANGAMENLGAVTFREQLLLVDPAKASRAELERIADVIAHEIAHMWFGDLVTMQWWNGLWLNEAFATFMEVHCVNAFRPEWEKWTSFSIYKAAAQGVDALHATRPIEFPVISPRDAEGMFDLITYEKGAGVLRMLEQYLGEDRFRDGVRHYLTKHSYANAETTDLWDAIEHTSGEPVRAMMDTWVFQGGFPLVSISQPNPKELRFEQRPFTYLAAPADSPDSRRWHAPVLYRTELSSGSFGSRTISGRLMLDRPAVTVSFPHPVTMAVGNAGGHGFLRVAYDDSLAVALRARFAELPAVERYGVVSDTWAAVVSGAASVEQFLSSIDALGTERDPNVWSAAVGGLNALDAIARTGGIDRATLHARVERVVAPALESLGWSAQPGETPLTGELRGALISTMGMLVEHGPTIERATSVLDRYLEDRSAADGDIAPALISIGAKVGGEGRYEHYVAIQHAGETPQEGVRFLQARGGFTDANLVARTLAATLTDDIRSQDAPYLLNSMLGHPVNGPATWAWFSSNWDAITERVPGNAVVRMIGMLPSLALVDPIAATEASEFFGPGGRTIPQGEKQLAQHLERVRVNIALRERVLKGRAS